MRRDNKIAYIALIIMMVLSFSNLFGVKIAGASVIIGVIFFFINKKRENHLFAGSGLDIKTIGPHLKERGIWFWIALPLIMDAISLTISTLFLPEYIEHVINRTEVFVSFDMVILMVFQLAFLALGEEIAWRAFFQRQLNKFLPILPTLLFSSVLFAFGHITEGNAFIVAYDIFFVFINSLLYGVIFYKTNNAWISAVSHFLANLFSVIVLFTIL